MKRKKLLVCYFLPLMLLANISSYAQNKINGTVTNENGDILAGATILLKGTTNNTVADSKGKYMLSSDQAFPWTITISYEIGRAHV